MEHRPRLRSPSQRSGPAARATRRFRRREIKKISSGAELAARTLLRLREREASHRAFRAAHLAFGAYDMSLTPRARAFVPTRI